MKSIYKIFCTDRLSYEKRCRFWGPLLLLYYAQCPMQIENVTTPGSEQILCRFWYKEGAIIGLPCLLPSVDKGMLSCHFLKTWFKLNGAPLFRSVTRLSSMIRLPCAFQWHTIYL